MFRGQSISDWPVTSTLCRAFCKSDRAKSLSSLEKSILTEAQYRIWPHTPKLEAFAELQHMGGMSNYIDFTSNVHVAVYYACAHNLHEDGAVYFLKSQELPALYPFEFGAGFCEESEMAADKHNSDLTVAFPGINPVNFSRVVMQESVFIQAKKGYIDLDKFYKKELIKAKDKQAALTHVKKQALLAGQDLFGDVIALVEQDSLFEPRYKPKGYMQLKLNQYDDLKEEAEFWKSCIINIPQINCLLMKEVAHLGYPHYRLGRISYSRGNYEKAEIEFLEALDKGCREPVRSKAHVNLASTYLRLGRHQEALSRLKEVNHYNYEEICHFMAAEAHFRMKNYQEARERIDKAVDMNRYKLTYLRLKVAVAFKLDLFAEAREYANLYMEYCPCDRQIFDIREKAKAAM